MARMAPIVSLLTLLVLLTGCAGAPPAPAQPPPPAGYQDRLARADRDIAAAFDAIGRVPDLPTLTRTVLAGAGIVSAAGEQLATGGPVPPPAAEANNTLVEALHRFATELAYLSQQINLHAICTGSTALSAITTAPSMPALRQAAAALAAAGYQWGDFLPAPLDQVDARPANGRLMVDRRTGAAGNGALEVSDNADADAVVILAGAGRTVLSVAVREGASTRVDGIPDGGYDVYYLTGSDWDDVVGIFGRHCDFHRFTDPSQFSSQPVAGGTAYTVKSITIQSIGADSPPNITEVEPDGLPR
ncbi:MAG TPA: hypothetical protein VGM60_08235 [Pseudonocardia sp.]|jgi:hypothetical protein